MKIKCAALLAVSVTTNARDESLRGANSPLSKTAIIDDAATKGHPAVIVIESSGRNEFDQWGDYELEPTEDPNPSAGGGPLDDILDEDATSVAYNQCAENLGSYSKYQCCFRERKALNKNDGYCQPWGNQGGDLCREQPTLYACRGATAHNAYLPTTCDKDCVKLRCHLEPKCKGYTWNKSADQGKLKSAISSVYGENDGYKCVVKGYLEPSHHYYICQYDDIQESQKEETK